MSSFLSLLLLVVGAAGVLLESSAMPDDDFFRECPPSRCSVGGPEVRFPFRLNTSSPSCGEPSIYVLRCSGNDTVVELRSSGTYMMMKVTGIDYTREEMTIDMGKLSSRCSPRSLPLLKLHSLPFFSYCGDFTIVNCSEEIPANGDNRGDFRGPIRCLSGAGHFAYAAGSDLPMDRLPAACEVVATGVVPPGILPLTDADYWTCSGWLSGGELALWWWSHGSYRCPFSCETDGGRCGFSRRENRTVCYYNPPSREKPTPVLLITGTTTAGVGVVAVALVYLYVTRKSSKARETHLKVEKFLATYRTMKPTRYAYSDIKKITRGFRHKLGQGGFGSVYQGELPNGVPVAVKMLNKSLGDGEEFINEVATTGRIHHVNVVRLLGFCSEGPRRALVYEFMPNESLEKFIFPKGASSRLPMSFEKLEEIAAGIARGIEYLHQGCNERILHFDIKPHNILLDHNLNPKISDFGLAKLCSKDQSAVSMTMARGTMGYIAPEIYSRNFGTVSYKSDVYSFGMLLTEMISGRKTMEPGIETDSQVYLPEQIYDRLVRGEEISPGMEIGGSQEIARKLAIVALWCIQWNPSDRPSMTRVVQMLTGSSSSLHMPPTPFVSFLDQD